MGFFAHVFGWLTTSSNWTGSQGILVLFWNQLKLVGGGGRAHGGRTLGGCLGVVLGHTGRGGLVAVNAANAFRAVPTLALLTLLAIQPAISLKWNGFLAAWLALTALAIPPILTNTYVGMREVDADVRDAAKGMGLTGGQRCCGPDRYAPLAAPFRHGRCALRTIEVVATLDARRLRELQRPRDLRDLGPRYPKLRRGLQWCPPRGGHGGADRAGARPPDQGADPPATAAAEALSLQGQGTFLSPGYGL